MDIPRQNPKRSRRIRAAAILAACVALVSIITVSLARLKPAAPTVDRATVWTGTVERGQMLRQVRGTGTLVPEEVRWIPAATDGQVERILVQPGSAVEADSVLVELSNPELQLEAQDASFRLTAGVADLERLRVQLDSEILRQEAEAARVHSEFQQARLRADTDEELAKRGLIAPLNQKLSRVTADELANRDRIEKERLSFARQSKESQLAARRAEVDQLRAQLTLRQSQVAGLRVRAGIAGVLQQVPVEVGQRVEAGTILARVAEPGKLKAEIRIPETQAKDLSIGQRASVDTRNGVVAGSVTRVDPAAEAGTVRVDVGFTEALPQGARPDLTVDGTIEIERLDDTVYVTRPVNAQPQAKMGLFKVVDGGAAAVRVQVDLGRSSVNTIEVVAGLEPGDLIILSDMSEWDSVDRVQLN